MMEIVLAFVTGLTTGGLSCLAVQGGLLAGSVAHEVEQAVADAAPPATAGVARGDARKQSAAQRTSAQIAAHHAQPRAARPIVLFLAAKLVAYTILGFLLGLAGSAVQLSPTARGILQAAIGIFMLGTALRMFNVHPIFRYFALEPPRFVTRYIRRKSKGEANALTPLFLGALTVLIPCGVTQAMMAVAMGAGNPVTGATIMFAFILGTSPVFFTVAYLATRLGARLEANFMRFVAAVVLVLGLVSVDAGLTLVGWPYSVTNLRLALAAGVATPAAPAAAATGLRPHVTAAPGGPTGAGNQPESPFASAQSSAGVLTIAVDASGYNPKVLHAKPGTPLRLSLVTKETYSCARAFVIPALGIEKVLPATGNTLIDIPAQAVGSKLFFSCSMGMYSGLISFDA